MNPFIFRAKEREAFKIAQETSLDAYQFPAPKPMSKETVRMILAAESSLKDMWTKHKKILIPAAKAKTPKLNKKGRPLLPPAIQVDGILVSDEV